MAVVNWLVAGICIVGSMVAIAATGGVATPLVVGLISGVSTAVITGTQEATAQYVEKGDWSEVDWLAVAGKTALGFASGFVTGWLGTHAGNFLTGFLTKGALPLLQSGSKVVRVTSYSVINGTVESGSGILTRFSGEAIVTNGDWKKAWNAAFDLQNILLDVAIGTVTGGFKGLEDPIPENTQQATLGAGETENVNYLENLDDFAKGAKNFDDVLDDYVKAYADSIDSNKPWTWKDIPGENTLNSKQKALIKQKAIELGKIPNIPAKPGTNNVDFNGADVIYKIDGKPVIEQLPQKMWLSSDKKQFAYLDSLLPGGKRPAGYTWHHSEISGQMELVPFGIPNSTWHHGGRTPSGWADAKR